MKNLIVVLLFFLLTVPCFAGTDWTLKHWEQEVGSHLERDIYGTDAGKIWYKFGMANHKVNPPRIFVYGVFEDRFTFAENRTFAMRIGVTYTPDKMNTIDGSIGIERDVYVPYDDRISYVFDFTRRF